LSLIPARCRRERVRNQERRGYGIFSSTIFYYFTTTELYYYQYPWDPTSDGKIRGLDST
jgi:hypothetical protein